MIKKLLLLIQETGVSNKSILAKKMNISVGLLDLMIEDLQRRGFLQIHKMPENMSCDICPFHKICKISKKDCNSNDSTTIKLTQKGLDFIQRSQQ